MLATLIAKLNDVSETALDHIDTFEGLLGDVDSTAELMHHVWGTPSRVSENFAKATCLYFKAVTITAKAVSMIPAGVAMDLKVVSEGLRPFRETFERSHSDAVYRRHCAAAAAAGHPDYW